MGDGPVAHPVDVGDGVVAHPVDVVRDHYARPPDVGLGRRDHHPGVVREVRDHHLGAALGRHPDVVRGHYARLGLAARDDLRPRVKETMAELQLPGLQRFHAAYSAEYRLYKSIL